MIFKTTSSAFGNLIEDDDLDFADVTLVCEDGHQVEAHKVILDGSRPQTIHTHWSEMEDFVFHPKYFKGYLAEFSNFPEVGFPLT